MVPEQQKMGKDMEDPNGLPRGRQVGAIDDGECSGPQFKRQQRHHAWQPKIRGRTIGFEYNRRAMPTGQRMRAGGDRSRVLDETTIRTKGRQHMITHLLNLLNLLNLLDKWGQGTRAECAKLPTRTVYLVTLRKRR